LVADTVSEKVNVKLGKPVTALRKL